MRKIMKLILSSCLFLPLILTGISRADDASAPKQQKEWTFLVFLNGNNNLDSYGTLNMNQMEKVGSSDDLNIVVQWASLAKKKVNRLYVQKDNNMNLVTSPIVQSMGSVDMGDYRNLVEFVRWGVENYPAKHYFINVWDHGGGWHLQNQRAAGGIHTNDISWDDLTGHFMTTVQLGQAMAESAKIIGHNVDLYGSDACLMAMVEVATEMGNSVDFFAGSQETEAAAGWPYDTFLQQWARNPKAGPGEVGKYLSEEYFKSYQGGANGFQDVTFSVYNMAHLAGLNNAITLFATDIQKLNSAERTKVISAASTTQDFTYGDYGDLMDFVSILKKSDVKSIEPTSLAGIESAMSSFVTTNSVSTGYKRASGVSIWLPSSKYEYSTYSKRYSTLQFSSGTKWGDALKFLFQDNPVN
ncbi:clostripain-related cysteine peptidase [Bdellovibrionota bacterium FG-2]